MKRLSFIIVLFLISCFFHACSPHPKEAFESLKQMEGSWKSNGNVIVYENWSLENDSLLIGFQFAERGGNKQVLERYRLERNKDSILFIIHRFGKPTENDCYPLIKARFGTFTFENPDAQYPNRLLIDFDGDSLFISRKENIRGNKSIEFEMKRRKE